MGSLQFSQKSRGVELDRSGEWSRHFGLDDIENWWKVQLVCSQSLEGLLES